MDQVAITPTHIHTYGMECLGGELTILNFLGTPASGNWPAANQAIYVPLNLEWPYPVSRVFWLNGATVTGAIDVGVYSLDGEQIFHSGATAQSGASSLQYAALSGLSNVVLPAGSYYLGMSCNGTTGLIQTSAGGGALGIPVFRMAGLLQQASAHPLPAVITPAAMATQTYPMFGITKTTTGF